MRACAGRAPAYVGARVKDLYQTLGVPRTASKQEIKKAYRALTQKFHPDKNPGDKAAEDRFKEVSAAYEVLEDEDRRKLYDEFGDISLTQGFDPERARAYQQAQRGFGTRPGPGGFGGFQFHDFGDARETSFDDLLSRLFGGGRIDDMGFGGPGGGPGGRIRRRGQDLSGDLRIGFLEALHGTTVPLRVDSNGGGSRTLDVKVPAGFPDGSKLRLRGQGGPGQPPGDILLTVHVGAHPRMTRDGQNLHMILPVTAYEAYRGGPVDVPTPWGAVTLKLPAGSQNRQTLRLRGKGIHAAGKPDGDLLVTLDVRMPAAGDEDLLAALQRLQADEKVREDVQMA